jgi:hypothetical protein
MFKIKNGEYKSMNVEKNKKELWIDEELHKDIKIFAIKTNSNIEAATRMLIMLGMCSHKEAKNND